MTDEPQVMGPRDPMVARVNALTTTFLDTVGVLLLCGAAGYGAWALWGLGWGLAAAGFWVMILSQVAQARQTPRPARGRRGAHPHLDPLPGPESPGTVHVMGSR